jgi:FKBP-type peptidyl-prolyl cis-trans isomerase SlyD
MRALCDVGKPHAMIPVMIISSPCVVSLAWRLEDAQGQLIDELHLEPEHAFGDYRAELVFFETRDIFPKEVTVGMQFEGPPEGATTPDLPKDVVYSVTEVYDTHVVLDGNHALAGIGLRLSIKVCDVRPATEEEVELGSVAESPFAIAANAGGAPPDETLH